MVLLLKICDIQSLTMLHVCMMRLKFCDQPTNQPTNEQGDSRSRMERREHNIRVKADFYPARF